MQQAFEGKLQEASERKPQQASEGNNATGL